MNSFLLTKLVSMFVNKKRVIGWVSALAMAAGAVAAGMQTQEFKDAVCTAPVITPVEQPK